MRWAHVAAFALAAVGLVGCQPAGHAAAQGVEDLLQAAFNLEADSKRGRRLYRDHCASCHGPSAHGDARRVIPALAGQRQAYLVKQLADFAEFDRAASEMHRVAARTGVNHPQDWIDLAAHLNALPAARFPQMGDGKFAPLGEAVFREQCASCHDVDARGDDEGFVPSMRNQHYSYLLQQMRGFALGHRANADEDLVRFIESLDDSELIGVADYLSRLRGAVRDRAKLRDDGSVGD